MGVKKMGIHLDPHQTTEVTTANNKQDHMHAKPEAVHTLHIKTCNRQQLAGAVLYPHHPPGTIFDIGLHQQPTKKLVCL